MMHTGGVVWHSIGVVSEPGWAMIECLTYVVVGTLQQALGDCRAGCGPGWLVWLM